MNNFFIIWFTMQASVQCTLSTPAGTAPRQRPSPSGFSRSGRPPRTRRGEALNAQAAREAEAPNTSTSGGGGGGDLFFAAGREGAERQRLFNTIAPVYDQLNDQLSLGLHRVWKRMTVKWSGAATGGRALDVCCGSGDLAFRLAEAVGPSGSVVGLDFSANMLADAARRQQQRQQTLGPAYNMEWVQVRFVGRCLCACVPCRHQQLLSPSPNAAVPPTSLHYPSRLAAG